MILNEVFMRTEMYKDLHLIQPVEKLIKDLTQMIYKREIKEISARDEDMPL
jgi:hypothetical protein